MNLAWILSAAALVSAAACIYGKYGGPTGVVYVFKPLTTVLITAIVVVLALPDVGTYAVLVLCAFLFALGGDVFLMLPRDRFIAGLASFLVAHVLLLGAFVSGGVHFTWWLLLPICIPGFGMYRLLLPHLGKMRIPVFAYVLVISIMAWQAWERWYSLRYPATLFAAVGAVVFMGSDSTLALNKFRATFRSAELIILSTYWLALWLIARSVVPVS